MLRIEKIWEDTMSHKIMIITTTAMLALISFGFSLAGQSATDTTLAKFQMEKNALMQVDRDFATMATDSGIANAFVYFAADSAAMLRRGSAPLVGRDTIRTLFADEAGTTLKWAPYFSDIASSNDLGYTLGSSQYIYNDSTGAQKISYGYYVTIWKKQRDGSWKYVLDTGVSAPPPITKPLR
jgi:ketosteroid isomerase-like protein